ncbi:hypothetical protein ALC53_09573 [Atta colombica]|uniref:Uncharacterized protein n=1 Tax=Atta colombica TaxID=520822 RepID=A0A195B713_9HYME|nr:hypothetical protein ALC53_09573 [Atta colombica]
MPYTPATLGSYSDDKSCPYRTAIKAFYMQRSGHGARELAPPRLATILAQLGGRDRAPPSSPDLGGGPVVAMCCGPP